MYMCSQYPNYKQTKEQVDYDTLYKWIQIDNLSYREIMYKYHYQERLVSKLAKEYNIPYGKARSKIQEHKFTQEEQQYIIIEYNNNKSAREIARNLKLSHATILRFLRNNCVPMRHANDTVNYESRRKQKFSEVKYVDSGGYKHTTKINENIRTHRYIMEQYLGRKLLPEEHVHHIDGNKTNNDITNLFLFKNNHIHLLYHGYIKRYQYVHPQEYIDTYQSKIEWLYSYDTLYDLYIQQNLSCNAIGKMYPQISTRYTISYALKKNKIYFLRPQTINQFI